MNIRLRVHDLAFGVHLLFMPFAYAQGPVSMPTFSPTTHDPGIVRTTWSRFKQTQRLQGWAGAYLPQACPESFPKITLVVLWSDIQETDIIAIFQDGGLQKYPLSGPIETSVGRTTILQDNDFDEHENRLTLTTFSTKNGTTTSSQNILMLDHDRLTVTKALLREKNGVLEDLSDPDDTCLYLKQDRDPSVSRSTDPTNFNKTAKAQK